MRHLYTLVLCICCFAIALQTQAAGTPLKKTGVPTEYQAVGQTVPDDALNNYHQLTAAINVAAYHTKESAVYFNALNYNHAAGDLSNKPVQDIPAFLNGCFAKTFLFKLLFPKHYHW